MQMQIQDEPEVIEWSPKGGEWKFHTIVPRANVFEQKRPRKDTIAIVSRASQWTKAPRTTDASDIRVVLGYISDADESDALASACERANLSYRWHEVSDETELEFNRLSEQWYRETGMLSLIHQKAMHPAYQRIIGMGRDALPFIFRELNQRRGHWFWALCAITGEDAAEPHHNFRQAVNAWLQWGERNGYL